MGELVLGRFEVEEKLGSGGFGTVYRAWDDRLERHVAVKAIEADDEATSRVLREAQAAARLNHPGIVTLYELGEEAGVAFLVSELVEGQTLRQLSREGRLSDRDVAEIGADLCEALDHAHSRGVVHRDIKPHNVLVGERDSQAKLMDFGIARILDEAALTATGHLVGTLAYMAPEQADGRPAGPEADVFSLALTLFECWSGDNPHLRGTPAATARAIGSALPSLARLRPQLPPDLTEAIDAALDRDPRRRPGLEELGSVLEDSLEELDDQAHCPAPREPLLGRLTGALDSGSAADVAAASTLAGLVAAAMIATGAGGPLWAYALPLMVAALALVRPRLGYLGAAGSLSAWLTLAAGRPGAGLLLAAITLPPAFLVRGDDRILALPALAPALGAFGAAALFPFAAAFADRRRDRAVLAATGFVWVAVAEVVLGRKLIFGLDIQPPSDWQESAGAAFTEVLLPLLAQPAVLAGAAVWVLAAVLAGALLAPLRARADRTGPRPARRSPAPPWQDAAPLGGGGRQATLS